MFPVSNSLSGHWLFLASRLTIVSLSCVIGFDSTTLVLNSRGIIGNHWYHGSQFSIHEKSAGLYPFSEGFIFKPALPCTNLFSFVLAFHQHGSNNSLSSSTRLGVFGTTGDKCEAIVLEKFSELF